MTKYKVIIVILFCLLIFSLFFKNQQNSPVVEESIIPTIIPTIVPTEIPKLLPSPFPTINIFVSPTPIKIYNSPTPFPQVQQNQIYIPPAQNSSSGFTCNCSKTCTQISSCEEAYYQLNTCGCSVRDGDHDGVPCEIICN